METVETVAETVGTVGTVTETVETVRTVPVHNSYSFCNSYDRFQLPRQFRHFFAVQAVESEGYSLLQQDITRFRGDRK